MARLLVLDGRRCRWRDEDTLARPTRTRDAHSPRASGSDGSAKCESTISVRAALAGKKKVGRPPTRVIFVSRRLAGTRRGSGARRYTAMRVRRVSDTEMAHAEDDTSSDEDSSSEDLSDSDADVDMPDESLMDQIMRTEQALEKDPTRYASHAKLVRLLRDANLRERLRDAREAMSSRFPLNETQWREWIADEVRHTKGKREARATVVGALFERAVADYVSVALWLGYAEFSLDQDWDHDRRRELYERALELAGLHFTDGHRVFAAYRAFELSILRRVEDDPVSTPDERARAESRVRALFRRQLAVPHAQLEETRAMAEAWESARPRAGGGKTDADAARNPAALPPETLAAYAKASSAAAALRPLEDTIVAAAASPKPARALTKAHRAHVSATETENRRANLNSSDASARARAAYERAVSATPTDAALWRRYTAHVDATCRVRVTRAATHVRATRNCPGDGETWASAIRFFHAESADGGNDDAARRTFERALVAGLATAEDELIVRLAGVHCGLCGWDEARDGLASSRPGWIDARLRLPALRAERALRGPSGDSDGAAAVWEEHCAGAGANVGEAHAARAEFLWRCLGRTEEARADFKRRFAQEGLASAAKPDEPGWAPVCRAWIRMEQAVGTPAQILEADVKAGAKLRALEAEATERNALDPEEATRMRREKDPNYTRAEKKAKKRKAVTNVNEDGRGRGRGTGTGTRAPRSVPAGTSRDLPPPPRRPQSPRRIRRRRIRRNSPRIPPSAPPSTRSITPIATRAPRSCVTFRSSARRMRSPRFSTGGAGRCRRESSRISRLENREGSRTWTSPRRAPSNSPSCATGRRSREEPSASRGPCLPGVGGPRSGRGRRGSLRLERRGARGGAEVWASGWG